MPPDVVSIAVTTGLGVSVFAGIISGVCYVLVCGFTKKRRREPELQWLCTVCGIYLRIRVKEEIKIVICSKCERRVCKRRCSRRDSQTKEWICYTCLKQPSFFQGILSIFPLFKKKKALTQSNQMGKTLNEDVNIKQQKDSVRDFIEKLVSTIVGGTVDDASVFRMYSDTQYNVVFDRYYQDLSDAITNLSSSLQISMQNASLSDQSPSSAHTSLKLLIEKILREATHLPPFRKPVENPIAPEERTYEDLLATAILNKIIDKHESSSAWSTTENAVDNDRFSTKYRTRNRSSESRWNDTESVSGSSVDDYVYSDSSHGSAKYVDRVSLTIQQRIEQVPSISEHEDIDTDYQHFSGKSSIIDDSSNWYLQKRHFQNSSSPVPVPMLVPNPLTSAKVLIGDKEIDDTSDLSDANSECNDVHTNLIIDSSLTIEEKATNNYSSDEQTSFDSGVREDRDDCSENLYYTEPKKTADVEDSSLFSIYSSVERDSEYLEKYSSLPTKIPSPSVEDYDDYDNDNHYHAIKFEKENQDVVDFEDSSPFYAGRYSKREKEKWKHPVNMPHNPYSEENIRKRIQTNDRFGRDYYTKQAALPSGRLKHQEVDDDFRAGETDGQHWAQPVNITDDLIDFEDEDETEQLDPCNLNGTQGVLEDDGKRFETRTNEKEVFSSDDNKPEIKVKQKEGFTSFLVDLTESPVDHDFDIFFGDKSPQKHETETRTIEIPPKIDYFSHPLLNKQASFNDIDNFDVRKPETVVTVNKKKPFSSSAVEDKKPTSIDENIVSKVEYKPLVHSESKIFVQTFVSTKTEPTLEEPPKGETPPLNRQLSASAFVPKKSDNTLIKKIYSNPVVRNFALTNREQIPGALKDEVKPRSAATNPVPPTNRKAVDNFSKGTLIKPEQKSAPVEKKEDAATYNFSLEFSDNESIKEQDEGDTDVKELKEKRLVANMLDKFSKSVPNLVKTSKKEEKQEIKERFKESREVFTQAQDISNGESEGQTYFTSVKKLRKLFEHNDASVYKKEKPVHSLTARSISKEMKQKLSNRHEGHLSVEKDDQFQDETFC